jgi:hypothetical protein
VAIALHREFQTRGRPLLVPGPGTGTGTEESGNATFRAHYAWSTPAYHVPSLVAARFRTSGDRKRRAAGIGMLRSVASPRLREEAVSFRVPHVKMTLGYQACPIL